MNLITMVTSKNDLYFFDILKLIRCFRQYTIMTNYCLTDIKRNMTILMIIYNDNLLKFYVKPSIFDHHFKKSLIYTINCPGITEKSFISSVNNLFGYLENGKDSDGEESDDEPCDVFNNNCALMFMDITFKNPVRYIEYQSHVLDNYKTMLDICSGTKDISRDTFKKMIDIISDVFPEIVTYCIVYENNHINSPGISQVGIIEARHITGPMCFFKNYGTLTKISYRETSKYDPKYDTSYTFSGNDYVKSLHRVLRYMFLKKKGFMPGMILDVRSQISTLLSGSLFDGFTDTIDFNDYANYINKILRGPEPKISIKELISEDEESDNDDDVIIAKKTCTRDVFSDDELSDFDDDNDI